MVKFFKIIKFCSRNIKYAIKFFPTFLDNISVYLFKKKANKGPLFVVWDITDVCDCYCAYCDHWRNPLSYKELELDKKLEIIDVLAEMDVGGISICGGEPLWVDGTEEVIKRAKSHGLFVNIDTNGSKLFENAEMLVKNKVDSIIVSIEAGGSKEHNTIRVDKNLFEKINKGVCQLKNIRSRSTPQIIARAIIHKQSYKHLERFVQYWENKVDDIIFQPIYHSTNNFLKIPNRLNIDEPEKVEFQNIYNDLLAKHSELNTTFNRLVPDYFFNFDLIKSKYRCFQGIFLGDVDSRGNLYTCTERYTKLGNLLDDSMGTLWNSQKACQSRRKNNEMTKCYWQAHAIMSIYLTKLLNPGFTKKQSV